MFQKVKDKSKLQQIVSTLQVFLQTTLQSLTSCLGSLHPLILLPPKQNKKKKQNRRVGGTGSEADGAFLTWVTAFSCKIFSGCVQVVLSGKGSVTQNHLKVGRVGCTSPLFVLHPDRHRWVWLQQLPFIPVCAPLIPNANLLL